MSAADVPPQPGSPDDREQPPAAAAGEPPVGARRPRRRKRRVILAVLAGTVLVLGVWTVVCGLLAASRLTDVRGEIARLTKQHGDRTTLERALQRDLRTVSSARSLLHQPGPAVVAALPLFGRNVRAERTVTTASHDALAAGVTLLHSTEHLSDGAGGVDLGRLDSAAVSLQRAADSVAPSLRALRALNVGLTLPPVSDGVRQARDQLLGLDERLRRGAAGLQGVSGILGGSGRRTVFVGLTNNAELRGTEGLLAGYATGTTDNGRLELRPFADVTGIAQPPNRAQRVDAPADLHSAYGFYLADTTLWKNITMSPRGDETAQVVAAAAQVSLHVRPDVVVLIDVPATAAIVSATGPITVGDQKVTGDELTRRLLVDAYESGSLSQAAQERRHRLLNAAATQAVDRLRGSASASPALLNALLDATAGRHLVLWSARPDEQRDLERAGVAGALDAAGTDVALVAGNNLGDAPGYGNKLDYYVDRRLRVDVRLHVHEATVTQTLTLVNHVNMDRGPYVIGTRHPGMLTELLSMSAASAGRLTSFTKDGQDVSVTRSVADGGQRLTTVLRLPAGATTTYRLTYTVPVTGHQYRLLLVPQALAHPADLELRISAKDATLGVVSGMHQPKDGVATLSGPWTSVHDVTVPVQPLRGLRAVMHAIAHFWSHKISL